MLLYKYRDLTDLDKVADILLCERLYCAPYFKLNDPFEGTCFQVCKEGFLGNPRARHIRRLFVDDVNDEGREIRICSLSSNSSDVRLWSLYAGSHRGIAIEIDFDHLAPAPFKVEYIKGLKVFGHDVAPSERNLLSYKTKHWDYESEYRVFTDECYYSIQGRIKRILLGPRITKPAKEILGRLKPSVALVKTFLDLKTVSVKVATQKTE